MSIENLQIFANEASVEYSDVGAGLSDNYLSKETSKLQAELPRTSEKASTKKAKKSLFNNFYVFTGDSSNVYSDEDLQATNKFKNPSIQNLVANKQGANRFDYSDFIYAKQFGELPNNRLITLRRFKYPCHDDIFSGQHEPDIARMVTWFDNVDNKLNDIFSMSFGLNWKQLEATIESMSMEGDASGYSGVIGKVLRDYLSPNTNPQEYYDPTKDTNKVHGPVDSISKTHIRDIGLNFEQEITLKFKYELRSIDGVNPKTAFMDLLSHILVCTMNDGKFWGGARYWSGRPPSPYAQRIRHWTLKHFADFTQRSNVNIKSMLSSLASAASNTSAQQVVNMAMQVLKNLAISKILDIAGRASVPTMTSLLTNEPVGEWHITVGNPFRPIFVAGNLILENTTIEIDDETLGYDDFPTSLVVTCKLKHAMPRDRAGIEKMFSLGNSRQYFKPTTDSFKKITDAKVGKYVKESMQGHALGNIAVVSRELYAFAATKLYDYSDKYDSQKSESTQSAAKTTEVAKK